MTRSLTVLSWVSLAAMLLAACAPFATGPRISNTEAASRICAARGLASGTPAYDQCFREQFARFSEENREHGDAD